ncbi:MULTISPECIES: GDYXXLXY domain-containing protein [unclassified Psychrobacter]|uniref:GDYXXLXY domain-containing protein n=1 Tax=unclassified Psychrobacter TaxID=196806 RepID=UPI0025F64A9A|nr:MULTISPECIES: GDYXXLXY domain-containing protein [unclassified Psychrobacter]
MKNKILTKRLVNQTSPSTHWLKKPLVTIVIALLGLILVLAVITINISKYENYLINGKTVLLELAPVDPRGFMQGDYMALSYALERDIFAALQPKKRDRDLEGLENLENLESLQPDFRIYEPSDGFVIVKVDTNNVGHFMRLANNHKNGNLQTNLAADELAIHYRIRNGSVHLATNAFFFQEGHGEAFEAAKYGLFRVNDKGEPLLTHLVDDAFIMIGSKSN